MLKTQNSTGAKSTQGYRRGSTKTKTTPVIGQDLLKMYKYFPYEKYFITKVLMSSGQVWHKITKLAPSTGLPGGLKTRGWQVLEFTKETPETLRLKWKSQGWILPRSYWVGPKSFQPQLISKSRVRVVKKIIEQNFSFESFAQDTETKLQDDSANSQLNLDLQPAKLKPIPSMTEKWFWKDLTSEEQKKLLRKWGYSI